MVGQAEYAGAKAKRGMRPGDLFTLRWVSDAQISADGRRVAFVVTRLDEESDGYRSSIYIVPVVGGEARRLTSSGRRDSAPRWSPDGTLLAFLSERGEEKSQIYIMPAEGGEPEKLTSAPLGAGIPIWSPDGSALCHAAKVPSPEAVERDRKDAKKAPPPRVITTLRYKLNAEGFTYDRHRHLFVVALGDREERQLTSGDLDDESPSWTADGTAIVFVSARHVDRDLDQIKDLFRVPAAGGDAERLRSGPFDIDASACDPRGDGVLFLATDQPDDPPRHARLWRWESGVTSCLSTGLDRNLTAAPVPVAAIGCVLVLVQDRGNVELRSIDAATGQSQTIAGGERSVAGFSVDGSGRTIAFTASRTDAPAEGFVVCSDGRGERRLTALNAGVLEEVSFQPAERFTATAEGGPAIDAWLMRPAGYQPGTPHPLLLNIHGGPYAQYGNTFLDEFQVQASAGFGVLFCNPRGSTGYDEEFARAIIGETGIKDSADVLAALDAALQTFPDIDAQRLGVMGGSYGGYLTNWLLGHTDRFAVACSERSISNRLSKAGNDDVYTTRTYFRDEVWRDPGLFLRLSPLMFVEQMHTPLLLLHSEEDLRCPIEQAEQLFTALKRLRRDVVFVRFPGENHELTRNGKPSHRLRRFEIQIDFFRDRLARVPAGAVAGDAALQ